MKRFSVLSALLLIVSILGVVMAFLIVFNRYDYVWRNFEPMFILCVVTFTAGFIIFLCAPSSRNRS